MASPGMLYLSFLRFTLHWFAMERQGRAKDRLAQVIARRDWVTTAQVAAAAGVHQSTLGRWQRRGLLPEPVFVSLGKRGRSQRWPPQTIEHAAWIKARLEDGWTFDELSTALAAGEFQARTSASPTGSTEEPDNTR